MLLEAIKAWYIHTVHTDLGFADVVVNMLERVFGLQIRTIL